MREVRSGPVPSSVGKTAIRGGKVRPREKFRIGMQRKRVPTFIGSPCACVIRKLCTMSCDPLAALHRRRDFIGAQKCGLAVKFPRVLFRPEIALSPLIEHRSGDLWSGSRPWRLDNLIHNTRFSDCANFNIHTVWTVNKPCHWQWGIEPTDHLSSARTCQGVLVLLHHGGGPRQHLQGGLAAFHPEHFVAQRALFVLSAGLSTRPRRTCWADVRRDSDKGDNAACSQTEERTKIPTIARQIPAIHPINMLVCLQKYAQGGTAYRGILFVEGGTVM